MAHQIDLPDALRAVGRLLDVEKAESADLVMFLDFLTVKWSYGSSSIRRSFTAGQLAQLMNQAILGRRHGEGGPGRRAEQFRTLGQEMLLQNSSIFGILEDPDGLDIVTLTGTRFGTRRYTASQIAERSRLRQLARSGQ